jgi:hypothetical protein
MSDTYRVFRHLAFESADPAPSTADVARVEGLLGAELPQSYRDFLAVGNGGNLEYVVSVAFPDGHVEDMSFGAFFTLGSSGRRERAMDELLRARKGYKIPPGVLPIARDGGGSILFLDLTTEGQGRIVAFVEGLPAWTGRRAESGFIEVAPSFDAYVAALRIDKESVLDTLQHDARELSHVAATEEWLDIGMPDWRSDADLLEAVAEAKRRLTTSCT